MAYQNVSFRNAERILEGKKNEKMEVYDRYEKPGQWPSYATVTKAQIAMQERK